MTSLRSNILPLLFLGFILPVNTFATTLSETTLSETTWRFLKNHCYDCHSGSNVKGHLDLSKIDNKIQDLTTSGFWSLLHDRVRDGEMPPPDHSTVDQQESSRFLSDLANAIITFEDERFAREGRAVQRRMNRYEYESTLRDLLSTPWLPIKQMLPEDGEAFRFNKIGEALDVSHVQMARYMAAADFALRQVIEPGMKERPKTEVQRYYARDSRAFYRKIQYSVFNKSPERATFPILGFEADLPALEGTSPVSVGDSDPSRRDLEAMGVVASTYEPLEIKFDAFKAPVSGKYKLRFNAYSFWAHPESEEKWWRPSRSKLSQGRSREPISVYAETPPRLLRKIGNFEVDPNPNTYELEVELLAGETIRPDAVRLFRSRPPGPWRNPLAEKEGQPGVAFRWLEVEGPRIDCWPTKGFELLMGDSGVALANKEGRSVRQVCLEEGRFLLRRFLSRAYRQPIDDQELVPFMKVVEKSMDLGNPFRESMIAGYTAILCSPGFLTLAERPGKLDSRQIATRLSYFLWNSEPDEELRNLAEANSLHGRENLMQQVERLLNDPKSDRFVSAFLDYWLDLRKVEATSPDGELYPDYYLDDYLVESSVEETRAFFRELLEKNLPVRNLIDSNFVMVNERLAKHYGIEGVEGIAIRSVPIDATCVRGGLLTQASILKITANGTTTSPVLRGIWMTERLLGKRIPPPPAAVPAIEPDTRGATTIREQLERHRVEETCHACHAKIDPPGFALESFDILGGFRERYRVTNQETIPASQKLDAKGFGKNGQPFTFLDGPEVDSSGKLMDGSSFSDLKELKENILADERQVARNMLSQLLVYATGAPIRFGDRPEIEKILDGIQADGFGLRQMIHEIVLSELFQSK